MNSTNHVSPTRQRKSSEDLHRWLNRRLSDAAGRGVPILRLRVIRTSSKDIEQWKASATTSFASIERVGDADVRRAIELGYDVIRRDIIGDSKRADLGDDVFELRMYHAPGGRGRSQVGVFLLVGQTLFLYLLGSARAGNLITDNDERRGNAATEIISAGVRAMATAGRAVEPAYQPELHAREHERIVRSELYGAELKQRLIRYRAIVHNPTRLDMVDPGAQNSFTFGTLMGSAAVEASIKSMNRQEIVIQANGGYYEHVRAVPFTHGPVHTTERDPRSGREVISVNEHRLAPVADVDEARRILRKLVNKILETGRGTRPGKPPVTDWKAVGKLAGELGLPMRRPEDLKKGVLIREVGPSAQKAAVTTLFSRKWIHGWQHGYLVKDVKEKAAQTLDLGELVEIIKEGEDTYYRCHVEMPLPPGGWGVTDDEWQEVLRRRYPKDGQDQPSASGNRFPLGGLTWVDSTNNLQCRIFTNGRYNLFGRPAVIGSSERDEARTWADDTGRRLATMAPSALHRSVGQAMQAALLHLDARTEPAIISYPEKARTESDAERLRSARDEAITEVQDADDLLAGAEDDLNLARGRARRDPGPETDRALQRAQGALERGTAAYAHARARLEACEAALVTGTSTDNSEPDERDARVETATAEFTAVALQKCLGTAPAWLKDACNWFLDDWRMTVVKEDGERATVRWRCRMSLNVVDSEQTVIVPLNGEVHSSSNRRTGDAPTNVEDWAWRFFYLGQDLLEVASHAGIQATHDKNTYIYKLLHDWLAPAVPEISLRTAALHCPVPATRRVFYFMVTGDPDAIRGLTPAFVDHVRAVFSREGGVTSWTWSRDTHGLVRAAIRTLLLRTDRSAPLHELLADLSISQTDLLWLAREPQADTSSAARTPVPYLVKNFDHTRSQKDRRLSLRRCPHADCPERLRGGEPWCTIAIRTPETEEGNAVLCPSCRRLPVAALRRVYFPADYLRPWSGRFGKGSHNTARKSILPTFLDPSEPDPGPAPALPDTGCRPRQLEVRLKRSDVYIPVHERAAMALGARTFLLESLDTSDLTFVRSFLTENGGREAQRLRSSVAAVVVDSVSRRSRRLDRARALEIPVVTVRTLLQTPPESWVKR